MNVEFEEVDIQIYVDIKVVDNIIDYNNNNITRDNNNISRDNNNISTDNNSITTDNNNITTDIIKLTIDIYENNYNDLLLQLNNNENFNFNNSNDNNNEIIQSMEIESSDHESKTYKPYMYIDSSSTINNTYYTPLPSEEYISANSNNNPLLIQGPPLPKKLRKRNRWGKTPEDMKKTLLLTSLGYEDDILDNDNDKKLRRNNRFGSITDRIDITGDPMIAAAASNLTADETTALVLRLKIDDLTKQIGVYSRSQGIVGDTMIGMLEENRSPSPDPIYDHTGRRINTRNNRKRDKLINERNEYIERAFKTIPNFIPPGDYINPRLESKVFIPLKQFPNQSYMQVIIGPRGLTHKELEETLKVKIFIRGRGSSDFKANPTPQPGDDEDIHVFIQGTREELVDEATRRIKQLLNPDSDLTDHKNRQLAHLNVMNGSIVDVKCRICQQSGHQIWNCPTRMSAGYRAAVVCELCGESSHITKDCKKLIGTTIEDEMKKVDEEYDTFMREINDGGPTMNASLDLKQLTGPSGSVPVVVNTKKDVSATGGVKAEYFPAPAPVFYNPLSAMYNPLMNPLMMGNPLFNYNMQPNMTSSVINKIPPPPPPKVAPPPPTAPKPKPPPPK